MQISSLPNEYVWKQENCKTCEISHKKMCDEWNCCESDLVELTHWIYSLTISKGWYKNKRRKALEKVSYKNILSTVICQQIL